MNCALRSQKTLQAPKNVTLFVALFCYFQNPALNFIHKIINAILKVATFTGNINLPYVNVFKVFEIGNPRANFLFPLKMR